MLTQVVQRCAALLSGGPDAVLPTGRIGGRRPGAAQDLPAVVLTVELDADRAAALGRELHWDAQRRAVQHGDVVSGLLLTEAWAATSQEVTALTSAVERVLTSAAPAVRAAGLLHVRPVSLDAVEVVRVEPPTSSALGAWEQRARYRFACEVTGVPPETGGGPVRRIDVAGTTGTFTITGARGGDDG